MKIGIYSAKKNLDGFCFTTGKWRNHNGYVYKTNRLYYSDNDPNSLKINNHIFQLPVEFLTT